MASWVVLMASKSSFTTTGRVSFSSNLWPLATTRLALLVAQSADSLPSMSSFLLIFLPRSFSTLGGCARLPPTLFGDWAAVEAPMSLWTLDTPLPLPHVDTECLMPAVGLGAYGCLEFASMAVTALLMMSGLYSVLKALGNSVSPDDLPSRS